MSSSVFDTSSDDRGTDETPWRDYDTFYSMYVESDETVPEIARMWNCSTSTVRYWRTKHDVPERDGTGSIPELEDDDDEGETNVEDMDRLTFLRKRDMSEEIADAVGFEYDPDRAGRATDSSKFLHGQLCQIVESLVPDWKDRFEEDFEMYGDDWEVEWIDREELIAVIEEEYDVEIEHGADATVQRDGLKTLHRLIVQGDCDNR